MQGSTTRNAQAAAVSRKLREAGIRPLPSETPRSREGLRVRRGATDDTVYVSADFDLSRERRSAIEAASEALSEAGYAVPRRRLSPHRHRPVTLPTPRERRGADPTGRTAP